MFIKKSYNRIYNILKLIPSEMAVFLFALVYRLPTLGYDFINNDAFLWKGRGYAFGSALTSLDFAGTAVTYHPGVPLLWSQFVAIKIYSLLSDLGVYVNLPPKEEFLVNNYLQTLMIVIITAVLITIAYRQLKRILGVKFALLSVVLILLEPFYLALSRTIHSDAMISLFMFISVLYFYSYINSSGGSIWKVLSRVFGGSPKVKYVSPDSILAGIFAGLAFLTKSHALFLIPFFTLIGGIYYLRLRENTIIFKTLTVFAFSVLTFFVVWPAMWVQPIQSVSLYLFEGVQATALEEGHTQYWFGEVTSDPGWLFYPVTFLGRYTIPLVALFFVSIYLLIKNRNKLIKGQNLDLILFLVLFCVFYLVMISLPSKKLDRYSLPIVMPLGVIGAWVSYTVLTRKVFITLAGILLVVRLMLFYGIHPNYLAYYSPVIGGVEGGRSVLEPQWMVGYDEIAKFFNEKQNRQDEVIRVAIADHYYLEPFAEFKVLDINIEAERDRADYFVLQSFNRKDSLYSENYKMERLNDRIYIVGVDYYNIYKVDGRKTK